MARILAGLHVAYGVVAGIAAGWMLVVLITDPDSAGGCCGAAFAPVFIGLFATVFVLAVPQLVVAWLFLRGHPRGPLLMAVLSGVNLLVNLATAGLVVTGGGGAWVLAWVPFLAVNALAAAVFARL